MKALPLLGSLLILFGALECRSRPASLGSSRSPVPRRLEDEDDLQQAAEANQQQNMISVMSMMEREGQIQKIEQLIGDFQDQLNQLNNAVSSEITSLGQVVTRNYREI